MARNGKKAKTLAKRLARFGWKTGKSVAHKGECYTLKKACQRYQVKCGREMKK